jgi:hypothetical protein
LAADHLIFQAPRGIKYVRMSQESPQIDTKLLLEELLGDDHCLIHVNPSYPGVIIPDHLRKEPTVTMKLSHFFAGRVVLRENRVEAELRFGASPFACIVPYEAIWAASSVTGALTIWEQRALHPSLPRMLKESVGMDVSPAHVAPAVAKAHKAELSSVPGKETGPVAAEGDKKRPSFLKRIK